MLNALIVAFSLLGATVLGLFWRRTAGRFRPVGPPGDRVAARKAADSAGGGAGDATDPARDTAVRIHPDAVGAELGERFTLVQFSSAFCAPCRATRRILAHVARAVPGVVHIDLDAEQHLDLVRRLDVIRTPTTLILDGTGVVIARASGAPTTQQVLAVLAGTDPHPVAAGTDALAAGRGRQGSAAG